MGWLRDAFREHGAKMPPWRNATTIDLTQLEKRLMTSIADLKAAVAANVEATKVMKARFETDIAALKAQLDAINAELAGVTDDVKADTADELGSGGQSMGGVNE
jgi:hypothetical protein